MTKKQVEPSAERHAQAKVTEQHLVSAGQRKINLIWEYTQASIAVTVVLANVFYIFLLVFIKDVTTTATTAAVLLSNAFFLVIGFYFGRTNHARLGDDPHDDGTENKGSRT